jgi:glycosyltransferase involved in cell wall biosynthesis
MGSAFARPEDDLPTADVSVVIPVYNHDRFVRAAIESVLSQTVHPCEILCIDDGSTDSSAQILETMAAQHPSVRFWSRSNQGAYRTINEGIRGARARYLAILNSDDLYHPERLRRCLAVLEEDAGVTAVATGISFVDENDNPIRYPWYEETHAFYEEIRDLGLALVNGNFLMTTSNIVVRRAVFDEIGAFDDLRYAHDLDFFLRLLALGKRLSVLPEQLLTYRVHGGNTIFEAPLEMKLERALAVASFAHRLVSAGGASGLEPQYLSRITEITERHNLTRLVALSLLHAQRQGTGTLSPGECLADPVFRSETSHKMGVANLAAAEMASASAASPVRVSGAEAPVHGHGTTVTRPLGRRLLDRLLRRPLPRRFFTSVRWRSGLDADLQDHAERLDRLAAALDVSRVHAETAEARLDAEARRIEHALGAQLATLDTAGRELLARGDTLESRLTAVESSLVAAGSRVAALEIRQADADHARAQSGQRLDELAAMVRDASADLGTRLDSLGQTVKSASVWAEIVFRSAWSALAPLTDELTVSVILPTRNRAALLRQAVASVVAQTYPRWELVVVNDASTDNTASVMESFADHRVRVVDSDGSGAGRARNVGLRAASGSMIAFLDDDNLMAPGWLRAVVVAFQERPDLHAVYGAQLRASERTSPNEASLLFLPQFDWESLLQGNFIDLGVVAHRAGLPGLRFDESLPRLIDWDYIVMLAGHFGIEPLPVLASFYTTDAPMRVSDRGSYERIAKVLRRRFRDAFEAVSTPRDGEDSAQPAARGQPGENAGDVRPLVSRGSRPRG